MKKSILFLLAFTCTLTWTYAVGPAVEKVETETEETVFVSVEQMPGFPGGQEEMMKYLSTNLRYPTDAAEIGIEGRVILQFIVQKDGSITNIEVIRSVYKSLDNEAVRVISNMPKWKPGYQRGVPVNVQYTIPVTFRLQK